MALNLQYIFTLFFRIAISSYFISCGLNWQQTPNTSFALLSKNLQLYQFTKGLQIQQFYLTVYSHILVIIGTALLFGYKIGKYLAFLALIINQMFLSQKNQFIFFAIKIIMIGILMQVELKRK